MTDKWRLHDERIERARGVGAGGLLMVGWNRSEMRPLTLGEAVALLRAALPPEATEQVGLRLPRRRTEAPRATVLVELPRQMNGQMNGQTNETMLSGGAR